MGQSRGFTLFSAALVLAALCFAAPARAAVLSDLYYASATMGAPNQGSGMSVYSDQFVGVRFDVATTIALEAAGGHFHDVNVGTGNHQIFGAIVKFTSDLDFPDSNNLSTPDVLRTFTFIPPPSGASADLIINFPSLTLTLGKYGVIFGSGLFGATGFGSAPNLGQPPIGSPVFIGYNSING